MLCGMDHHLDDRRLYIADLAGRLHAMETGEVPLEPLGYRVLAMRLRQALAGVAEPLLRAGFPELPAHLLPLVTETLDARHFENHGQLFGQGSTPSAVEARVLIRRLTRPPTGGPLRRGAAGR